jgi:exosortase
MNQPAATGSMLAGDRPERRGALPFSALWWLRAGLLLVPVVVMYYDSVLKLAGDWWNDANNSHGLLIPPLALYFAWERRNRVLARPPQPRLVAGLMAVLGALIVFFLGRLGAEFFLTRVSGVLLAAGLVLYFWGWRRLRALAFILFLMVLAIPLPALIFNSFALPLQAFASRCGSALLQFSNVAVLREGNVIYLSNTSLGVAEACSGLRSLVSLFTLAVIVACLRWRHWPQRLLLVALSVPLAVLLNVVRIWLTGLIAEYFNPEYAEGFFHLFSGWIVFVLAFGLLLAAASLIHRLLPPSAAEAQALPSEARP